VNKKAAIDKQNSSSAAATSRERNIHQRSGAAIGIGAFEIEICSKTTTTPKGEVSRSITVGTSAVKPPLYGFDLRMFWRNPEGTNAQSLKSGSIYKQFQIFPLQKEEERSDLIRCPAPA